MNFDDYYNTEIEPLINNFENYRVRTLKKYIINILILFLVFLSNIVFFYFFNSGLFKDAYNSFIYPHYYVQNNFNFLLPFTFISIILIAWLFKVNSNLLKSFKIKIRNELYRRIIAFYPQLDYQPDKGIDINIIRDSYLFSRFNQFFLKDYIRGKYKNINLELSGVKLLNITKEYVYENGKWVAKTNINEIFNGIFCILDINKNLNSQTYVIPNQLIKFFNNLPSGLKRVKLEDPNFEGIFDVYSDSQIDSRYILTPAFMERLVKLNDKKKLSCFFYDRKIFLALATKQDFLPELSVRKKMNFDQVKSLLEDVKIFFDIIDTLEL